MGSYLRLGYHFYCDRIPVFGDQRVEIIFARIRIEEPFPILFVVPIMSLKTSAMAADFEITYLVFAKIALDLIRYPGKFEQ